MTVLLLLAVQENVSPALFHTRVGLASAQVRNPDKLGSENSASPTQTLFQWISFQ